MTSETAAIEKTLWTYLDGLHEGDADKIASAFHPVSHLYSEANGDVADVPRDKWLDMVRSRPSAKSQGLARHDRIVTIDQSGPVSAFAKVECALPPRFFCRLPDAAQDQGRLAHRRQGVQDRDAIASVFAAGGLEPADFLSRHSSSVPRMPFGM